MKRNQLMNIVVFGFGIMCGIILLACVDKVIEVTTNNPDTRSIKATATAKYYYEDGDYISMEFTDETGNMWIVDDCVCNLGAECLLTFDTKNTEEIEDDEIISIGISITVEKE